MDRGSPRASQASEMPPGTNERGSRRAPSPPGSLDFTKAPPDRHPLNAGPDLGISLQCEPAFQKIPRRCPENKNTWPDRTRRTKFPAYGHKKIDSDAPIGHWRKPERRNHETCSLSSLRAFPMPHWGLHTFVRDHCVVNPEPNTSETRIGRDRPVNPLDVNFV